MFNHFFTAYWFLKYKKKTLQKNLEIQMESLRLMVPDLTQRIYIDNGVLCIETKCVDLVPLLIVLKIHPNFEYEALLHIRAIDDPEKKLWFLFFYMFESVKYGSTLMIKVLPNESTSMPTIEKMFINASSFEREISDRSGVVFKIKKYKTK